MKARITPHNTWLLARVVLICALLVAFSLGDRVAPGRCLVDCLLAQNPNTSEGDRDETDPVEAKTARADVAPHRQPSRRAFCAQFLPPTINPPGRPHGSGSPISRHPADVHALVSPLLC